ncbi:hypothetical protein ACJA23_03540 [Mycoplasma corogypsi]|uniref:hypothetical protein n=1 Tax=Mycoplasma corogypsi TaxID=2106 RepID=UPI003873B62C
MKKGKVLLLFSSISAATLLSAACDVSNNNTESKKATTADKKSEVIIKNKNNMGVDIHTTSTTNVNLDANKETGTTTEPTPVETNTATETTSEPSMDKKPESVSPTPETPEPAEPVTPTKPVKPTPDPVTPPKPKPSVNTNGSGSTSGNNNNNNNTSRPKPPKPTKPAEVNNNNNSTNTNASILVTPEVNVPEFSKFFNEAKESATNEYPSVYITRNAAQVFNASFMLMAAEFNIRNNATNKPKLASQPYNDTILMIPNEVNDYNKTLNGEKQRFNFKNLLDTYGDVLKKTNDKFNVEAGQFSVINNSNLTGGAITNRSQDEHLILNKWKLHWSLI